MQKMYEDIIEKLSDRKRVFDGAIIHVDHMTATLPNGKQALREVAVHIGAAAVIPIDHDRNVYLVRQFRSPLEKVTLEIPAGKLEQGEDPMLSAIRELEEETGYLAHDVSKLSTILATPGYCNEHLHIYITKNVTKIEKPRLGDEDEDIEMNWYDLDDCINMIQNEIITDAKTVIGILYLKALM